MLTSKNNVPPPWSKLRGYLRARGWRDRNFFEFWRFLDQGGICIPKSHFCFYWFPNRRKLFSWQVFLNFKTVFWSLSDAFLIPEGKTLPWKLNFGNFWTIFLFTKVKRKEFFSQEESSLLSGHWLKIHSKISFYPIQTLRGRKNFPIFF